MVLFGGQTPTRQTLGSIYILDVQSDQYLQNTSLLGTPVIYNLKTNQRTTQFSLQALSTTPNKDINGAAIGGSIAGVTLLVAISFFAYTRYKSIRKRRDDGLISSLVAMENSSGRKNMQAVNIVLHDTPSSYEQPSASKRIHAPNQLGQSPHTILPMETDKDLGHGKELAIPNDSNVIDGDPSSSNTHRRFQNPQDRGQITPSLPSFSKSPQSLQSHGIRLTSYDDNAPLEEQYQQKQQNIEYLERLRLEQQAQVEILRQQLIANKRNSTEWGIYINIHKPQDTAIH
ncbi:hypothetical protein BGZ83_001006 [Gryganskiella cystojenkinii]|nr:hypothetical protein BGZ83_001006 [Gryganskiella cystojenkinii]